MSNINVRYIIEEVGSPFYGWVFKVVDQKAKDNCVICLCQNRKNAGIIAGLLNTEETKQDKEAFEKQVEEVQKEIGGV